MTQTHEGETTMLRRQKAIALEAETPTTSEPARITIKEPNLQTSTIKIEGIRPPMQNRFSEKQKEQIARAQKEGGSKVRSKKTRPPKACVGRAANTIAERQITALASTLPVVNARHPC
jgi:hypothetical protein